MADVFLSYAREDHERARRLAETLARAGWTVWWDRDIVPGQVFDQVIERELRAAKSVIVLWSAHSTASEWVRNEATVAAERGVLVPALIDDVTPPLEFRRRQAADLTGWMGDDAHPGLRALCAGVRATARGPSTGGEPAVSPGAAGRRRTRRSIAMLLLALPLVGLGLFWIVDRDSHAPGDGSPAAESGLADAVVGTYAGDVIADSKGPSRSDVTVTIRKIDARTVRVSSDYARLGTVTVALSRAGNQVLNADGDTTLRLDLDRDPPTLEYNPHGEVAYSGRRR